MAVSKVQSGSVPFANVMEGLRKIPALVPGVLVAESALASALAAAPADDEAPGRLAVAATPAFVPN
ncbi:hypothetical protein APR51_43545, partial [Variovorax paradoxus]